MLSEKRGQEKGVGATFHATLGSDIRGEPRVLIADLLKHEFGKNSKDSRGYCCCKYCVPRRSPTLSP